MARPAHQMTHVSRVVVTIIVALACLGTALGIAGCAGLGPRTDGVSGPIAWRVTDLRTETREINGQPFDGRAFTLVLKNISPGTITVTTMDEYRFQHRTNGRPTNLTGRWVLKSGEEWKIPKFYYTACHFQGGCSTARIRSRCSDSA